MYREKVTQFTIQQRNGKSPDIKVTRTQYIPKYTKRLKNMPTDYGITREQFHSILEKAAQPIEQPKEEVDDNNES